LLQSDVQPQALRIDDLARLTGLPSRTIRFYNTQGLFPPPTMRGRVAYYNQEHIVVLSLIQSLKAQNLPLEVIKQLLEIRASYGEVQMNLALKQRLLPVIAGTGQQVRLNRDELAQQANTSAEYIDGLLDLELLFPVQDEEELFFSGDDVLLVELYTHLEQLGLPLSLPSLIRFQLRQLVRSEVAAVEKHMLPRWQDENQPLELQTEQFEQILTLTDTLISVLHRKLVYLV
jgi:DNA-binding transcriptional MerR regulator